MAKRLFIVLCFAALTATACSPKEPAGAVNLEGKLNSGKVLASKDGVDIHEGYLELLQQVNPNLAAQLKSPVGKKRLIDNLLEQELLYKASLKKGVQNLPQYREKAALYERVIISQGLLEEEIDARAKKYYDENKGDEFSEVGLEHILIRTPRKIPGKKTTEGPTDQEALNKAKEAKKKLDEGVAWETVVEEYSDDRLTKSRGGDLGQIGREDRRAQRLQWKDLIDQAFKMKAGEISGPIKAEDGYHIIKVTEAAHVAPYDEVENRIKFKLRGEVKAEVLKDLGQGEVVYKDEEILKITEAPSANRPITKPHIPPQAAKVPETRPSQGKN